MRKRMAFPALLALFFIAALPALAQGSGPLLTVRLGIPTDTLINMGDLYHWGAALEGGASWQAKSWLILGGQATYGVSFGKSSAVPAVNHEAAVAARIGFGSLESFSASLIGGLVYFPNASANPFIPDIGISLDYRGFSLAVSTGSVSAGMSFRL